MQHRKLKNYKKYLKRLLTLAKAFRLKVIFKPGEAGIFVPANRSIQVEPGMSNTFTIAVLLHEIGHFLYDEQISREWASKVDNAYIAHHQRDVTENQHEVILLCEKKAWRNGKILAKILKIPTGKWFQKARDNSLATYRKAS